MTLPTLPLPETEPFPHVVVRDGWDDDRLNAVAREFPLPTDPRWVWFDNEHELKLQGPCEMWGDRTRELFAELDDYAPILADLFGIPELSMETIGGGYHLIPPGGHLAIHTDFNRSEDTGLYRRLNLLIYLNHGWVGTNVGPRPSLDGWLQLRGDDVRRSIPPEFNTTVIFETSDRSWHGHPVPTHRRWRLSVAAYYFSPEPPPGYRADHSTVWR